MRSRSTRRSSNGPSAVVIAWRAAHGLIAVGFLGAIAYVWWCAISGRRGPLLRLAIAALAGEALFVGANGGDCPLGPLGDRVGDPMPLFGLVLPPRAARLAVPVLGLVTAAGIALVAIRPPRPGEQGRVALR